MVTCLLTCQFPHRHYLQIQLTFITDQDQLDIQLPAWRPGRYELGNFARNVRHTSAVSQSNKALRWEKITKDRWRIYCPGGGEVRWSYEYYAAEINAGSTFLDSQMLYVNPVNCIFYDVARPDQSYRLKLDMPDDFILASSLPSSDEFNILASSFDELADSPFVASPLLETWTYYSNSVPFRIHIVGKNKPEKHRMIRDFEAFTNVHFKLFEDMPCEEYHFIFLFPEIPVRHGVEHQRSTVIAMGPSEGLLRDDRYFECLGISCHELFHTWNVKYIRPFEMRPYDFTCENYSRSGFVYEGVTTYYGDLLLWRSGVFSDEHYLSIIGSAVRSHLENDGRFSLSVADSSFDTWLDGYVVGAPGRKVSIYNEGCLIAFICDVLIMKATAGRRSLDDAMRSLYRNKLVAERGYSRDDYKKTLEQVSGSSFEELFSGIIHGTDDYLPWLEVCLDYLGLSIAYNENPDLLQSVFGMKCGKGRNGEWLVELVLSGSPADRAGVARGDILNLDVELVSKSEVPIRLEVQASSFGLTRDIVLSADAQKYLSIPVIQHKGAVEDAFMLWKARDRK